MSPGRLSQVRELLTGWQLPGEGDASTQPEQIRKGYEDLVCSLRRILEIDAFPAAARSLLERIAAMGYDGRACSHSDGCHDGPSCPAGGFWECEMGPHCDDWDVGWDEEHDNLFGAVEGARGLLARFP